MVSPRQALKQWRIVVVCGAILVAQNLFAAFPIVPAINTANNVNVTNFGAVGDGISDNTTSIQDAINSAATTNGGCTVEIPAASQPYLCGPITLKSKVNLQVDAGATLMALPYGTWPGTKTFLSGQSINNVEISGFGIIDGQGSPWWDAYHSSGISRPNFIAFDSSSNILIRDITLQNPPTFHIYLKNKNINVTVTNLTIDTPGSSPNTDGFDIASTNVVIENSHISDGDDDVEIGGSGGVAQDILVTNCVIGTGHGISIGSITSAGVSNILAIDCSFNGTDNGIRLKSDNGTNSASAGGLCQNLTYENITMSNIVKAPILIYSYYSELGTPSSVSPYYASTQKVDSVTSKTVIWRNITFSNITVYTPNLFAGIIWGRMEMPVTNVVFNDVNITAAKAFDIYNAAGVQFVNSTITLPAGRTNFLLYNAQITVSNSSPAANAISVDGLTTNGYGNVLNFYNQDASLMNTNCLDNGPLSLGSSLLAITNNLTLIPSTVFTYTLGTNAATVAVNGNLSLGGTNKISAGPGFGGGSYTLYTYTGTLSGSNPTLTGTPAGFSYAWNTATPNEVNLIVTPPAPGVPTNLTAAASNLLVNLNWFASSNDASFNLKRATTNGGPYSLLANLTTTNYADASVIPGTTYFYVVSGTNAAGESADSVQSSAAPLPSTISTNMSYQISPTQLQLSWPQDHTGWRLQIQTNTLGYGLGTNWVTVPNSTNVDQLPIAINPTNGSVFLRLVYP